MNTEIKQSRDTAVSAVLMDPKVICETKLYFRDSNLSTGETPVLRFHLSQFVANPPLRVFFVSSPLRGRLLDADVRTCLRSAGSNLGDRERNLREAASRLAAMPGVHVRRMSSLFDNPAIGGPAGSPPFLNAVAEIETTLRAEQLLSRLLEIERELGRTRTEKWGPRIIDLDLIFYGQQVTRTEGLTVPHPPCTSGGSCFSRWRNLHPICSIP